MHARSASDAEIHQDTLLMKHSRAHWINTWIILETARWLLVGVQYGHRFIHVIDPSPVKNRQAFDVASCAALQLGFKWKKKKEYLKFSNLIKKETKTVYDCGNAQPSSISSINELSYRDENPTKIETSGQRAISLMEHSASAVQNSVQES